MFNKLKHLIKREILVLKDGNFSENTTINSVEENTSRIRPIKTIPCPDADELYLIMEEFLEEFETCGKNPRTESCNNKTSRRLVLVFDYGKDEKES